MKKIVPEIKIKSKIINSCNDCPYNYYLDGKDNPENDGEGWDFVYTINKCTKKNRMISGYEIPDWCPLETLKNK